MLFGFLILVLLLYGTYKGWFVGMVPDWLVPESRKRGMRTGGRMVILVSVWVFVVALAYLIVTAFIEVYK